MYPSYPVQRYPRVTDANPTAALRMPPGSHFNGPSMEALANGYIGNEKQHPKKFSANYSMIFFHYLLLSLMLILMEITHSP